MIKDPKGVAVQRRQMYPNYSILSVAFRDYQELRQENIKLREALELAPEPVVQGRDELDEFINAYVEWYEQRRNPALPPPAAPAPGD